MKREIDIRRKVTYDFRDTSILITGGASGLGLASAMRFLESGGSVVIADYNGSQESIAEHIRFNFERDGTKFDEDRLVFIKTDVTKEEDVKAAVDLAVSRFGELNVLVASAGIGGDNNAIADETLKNWEKVNAVDYTGVMLSDKYAILQMRKQGKGGAIINLASMFGLVAVPTNVAYSAAKGGVVNLSRAAGIAYAGEGIRVNCVCPGVINTPLVPEDQKEAYRALHPMHRIGEDFEVASIIAFLASDDARFITGTTLAVDGGYTAG